MTVSVSVVIELAVGILTEEEEKKEEEEEEKQRDCVSVRFGIDNSLSTDLWQRGETEVTCAACRATTPVERGAIY